MIKLDIMNCWPHDEAVRFLQDNIYLSVFKPVITVNVDAIIKVLVVEEDVCSPNLKKNK